MTRVREKVAPCRRCLKARKEGQMTIYEDEPFVVTPPAGEDHKFYYHLSCFLEMMKSLEKMIDS